MRRRISIVLFAVTILAAGFAAEAASVNQRLAGYLDTLVRLDSQSWVFNQYDDGSITNVRVLNRSRSGRVATVYGEYSYNGGQRG